MQAIEYIAEIQRQLVETYGFPARADAPHIPDSVPDGTYPMMIDGKVDRVKIEDGKIFCGNFKDGIQ